MGNERFGRRDHDTHDARPAQRPGVEPSPGKATLTDPLAGIHSAPPGKATRTQQLPAAEEGSTDAAHDETSAARRPTFVALTEESSDLGQLAAPGAGLAAEGGDEEAGRVLGGAATEASTSNTKAPSWKANGRFQWWIKWKTDGRKGWLVQKITNTYSGTFGNGAAITDKSVGATPSYYEAWEVTSAGHVKPSAGSTNDQWERPDLGKGSRGSWSMKGEVYWTHKDPAHSGLHAGAIPDAGILVSGHSAPAGIGDVLLHRHANGHWDSTKKKPTHTGSAG